MDRSPRFRGICVEILERRQLMSSDIASLDGTGNNLSHPDWGSAGAALLRTAPADYADGKSAPTGTDRPSPRVISNTVAAALDEEDEAALNNRDLAAFIYAWGQFLDHDMDLTENASPASPFDVAVPTGDPQFDPTGTSKQVIHLNRSQFDPTTGTSSSNPRQQINSITAFIDGSVVYGSNAARAAALRAFVGGKLKTSKGDLLPFNTAGLPNANDAHIFPDDQLFLAGDKRANENVELTSLHTLFVREHNRLCDVIAGKHQSWSDEKIYQAARRIVAAEIQSITYNEFLPALLGENPLPRYRGYNASVNPGIANEFSTAAFRVGHTMLGDDVEFLDNDGEELRDELPLSGAFFNPPVVQETGIGPILKYLASDPAQEIDTHIVDGVRNFLFGQPGAGGFDLPSLNIQRGREHGLADYNSVRAAYGLPRVKDFDEITSDPELQKSLKDLYGSVDNIDLLVGGLAEDHVAGGSLGATFRRILVDQFQRLRDGDRFFFERTFSGSSLDWIENTKLSDLISRNTEIDNLQSNVFKFNVNISGKIFYDRNANGARSRRERGLDRSTAGRRGGRRRRNQNVAIRAIRVLVCGAGDVRSPRGFIAAMEADDTLVGEDRNHAWNGSLGREFWFCARPFGGASDCGFFVDPSEKLTRDFFTEEADRFSVIASLCPRRGGESAPRALP